ncbi:MAG TPA: zinc ribbon domain-containing protein [Sorangium sp.]|uniref:zinc ribbon domain-containing protein n=1 Tax=Sorangium sp. So ce1153 TaxID=3133333 RepID=UPI002C31C6B8|nr:zinc ribbon domain-containing protein [Sorangium sp.]
MSQASSGAARCRVCAAALAPGSDRCPQCGADQGAEACPHCGGVAGVSAHAELRFRCDVCGGPRVPVADARVKRSGREVPLLQKARAAASARSVWRAAGIAASALFGFEVFLFAVLLLVLSASFGLFAAGVLTMAPVAVFALWAFRRARSRGQDIAPALDAAWVSVASDVARQTERPLTASGLASTLRIGESQAEELLALLEVNDVVRGAVSPAGEFGYAPKLRVGAAPAGEAEADALAAEEEAFAAGRAAEPLAQRTAHVDPTKR